MAHNFQPDLLTHERTPTYLAHVCSSVGHHLTRPRSALSRVALVVLLALRLHVLLLGEHVAEAALVDVHVDGVDVAEEAVRRHGLGEARQELREVDEVHVEQNLLVHRQNPCTTQTRKFSRDSMQPIFHW